MWRRSILISKKNNLRSKIKSFLSQFTPKSLREYEIEDIIRFTGAGELEVYKMLSKMILSKEISGFLKNDKLIHRRENLDHPAVVLYHEGKFEQSLKYIEEHLEPNNMDLELLKIQYSNFFNLKQYVESRYLLQKALEKNQQQFSEWNLLGYTYFYEDKVDEAIKCWEKSVEIEPNFADAWDSLGEGWEKKGDLEKAAHYYAKALKINPKSLYQTNLKRVRDQIEKKK